MRNAVAGVALAIAAALAAPASAAALDYSTAGFGESTNHYAFGQAPVFMPDGKTVCSARTSRPATGTRSTARACRTGGGCACLTCTGPGSGTDNVNGVAAVRPQGDWVLFHSWRGHELTIGSPGYGGIGSSLWAMHPDGSDQTQLTDVQPASATPGRARGSTTTTPTGRPTARTSSGRTSTGTSSPAAVRASGTCASPTSSSQHGDSVADKRPRRPARQRPLVRDAVVGARRHRVPLHRDLLARARQRPRICSSAS